MDVIRQLSILKPGGAYKKTVVSYSTEVDIRRSLSMSDIISIGSVDCGDGCCEGSDDCCSCGDDTCGNICCCLEALADCDFCCDCCVCFG